MTKRSDRSVIWVIVSGLVGIILFLVLLAVLRYLSPIISNDFFSGIVDLLFANAGLVILFSVMFMIADVFMTFLFPLNLPAPFFSAVGGVFVVVFIFRIIGFLDSFYNLGVFPGLHLAEFILYPLVFILVLIAGYISIFSGLHEKWKRERVKAGAEGENPVCGDKTAGPCDAGTTRGTAGEKTWDDVGTEFRQMLYDAFHKMREELNRK